MTGAQIRRSGNNNMVVWKIGMFGNCLNIGRNNSSKLQQSNIEAENVAYAYRCSCLSAPQSSHYYMAPIMLLRIQAGNMDCSGEPHPTKDRVGRKDPGHGG